MFSQKLQDMLILSYFLKIVLKEAQSFVSIDGIYRVVSQDGHCLRSEKGREKLRHVSGQSETAGL